MHAFHDETAQEVLEAEYLLKQVVAVEGLAGLVQRFLKLLKDYSRVSVSYMRLLEMDSVGLLTEMHDCGKSSSLVFVDQS